MAQLELLAVSGDISGKRFKVGNGTIRLGRSSTNDIHVPDEQLSRNHCIFEALANGGISVTDLASANGTFVNGEMLGQNSLLLKEGDVVTAGSIALRVVAASAEGGDSIDLGLGMEQNAQHGDASKDSLPDGKVRPPLLKALWVAGAVLLGAVVGLMLYVAGQEPVEAPLRESDKDALDGMVEMNYEKVVANTSSIFRCCMSLSQNGVLRVMINDVPGENRHMDRSKVLDAFARSRLDEILSDKSFSALDRQYVGPDRDGEEYRSWKISVVYPDRVVSVSVVNTMLPDAFRDVCDKLEAFTKSELGIWAIQRSRADLVDSAKEAAKIARMKWDEREVEYGNIDAAIRAYREAIVYLDTINPKPPEYEIYLAELKAAEAEQNARYSEQRFKADRAINMGDWNTARLELQILCQMVPSRDDDRNREAMAKLNDIEKRTKGDR